ncbi:hypothetical protein BJ875DRAFT_49242 [Amylocarpus encephaloides]|uniref:Uncharacterized protein n=1 Tax=Amylocarpus encephaloides TaxID=45428 RepID=A0A9P7YGT9_9HELO|nr:hypothetical protein BJ875DRAFT_49242 [Amylocarpus encephaloides]
MANFLVFTTPLIIASLVSANTPLPPSLFTTDPLAIVKAAAPLWHFDIKTCFPTTGVQPDGSQTSSLPSDLCGVLTGGILDKGCPVQQKMNGPETPSTPFPTYYVARRCDKDGSWRVVYDVFFQKDTGHPYDWEWAAVKFLPNADGNYIRDGIWTEQDGNRPYTKWANVPHTFDGPDDKPQNNNKDRDHPKAYFGKWKHNVGLIFNDPFANDCLGAVVNKKDYHSDDYAFYAADNLVVNMAVPANYAYGDADSTPQSFNAGGRYDICGNLFA